MREADITSGCTPSAGSGAIGAQHTVDTTGEMVATNVLAEVAEGTGGEFFHDNNDLTAGFQRAASGFVYHCVEFTDPQDLRIAWALAVQREEGWLEVEELFVRPTFRHQGYGKGLLRSLEKRADELGCILKMWISHADIDASDISIIDKLISQIGLARKVSGYRWAPMVASPMGEHEIGQPIQPPAYSRPRSPLTIRF
jgi:GNAT superfamily N-acetyltransferase